MLWNDWIALFLRWFHIVAGIAWIGASFYFIWLDNNLEKPPKWKQDKGIKGDLWAVHGGGFYEVAKYSYGPETMPQTLHWFKWEAYTTWLSGVLLLVWIYYVGAEAYLIDPNVMDWQPSEAIAAGVSYIVIGFLVYELTCRSPLVKHPFAFAIFLVIFLIFASWVATQIFSGRAAYIHAGALIGTIMAGNVFTTIIPSQKRMVKAVMEKADIDPSWGTKAKLRSVHNNYLTLPILFIMISNHYPMTYQHPQSWAVLAAICIVSAWMRHFFNLKHVGIVRPYILITGFLAMMGIALWVTPPTTTLNSSTTASTQATVTDAQIMQVMQKHCLSCHSKAPTDDVFKVAPLGAMFDTLELMEQWKHKIYNRTVETKDMPFLNKSNMTEEERQIVADWYLQSQEKQNQS